MSFICQPYRRNERTRNWSSRYRATKIFRKSTKLLASIFGRVCIIHYQVYIFLLFDFTHSFDNLLQRWRRKPWRIQVYTFSSSFEFTFYFWDLKFVKFLQSNYFIIALETTLDSLIGKFDHILMHWMQMH